MNTSLKPLTMGPPKRQGRLLAFGMSGAMALALTACSREPVMVAPPNNFQTAEATWFDNTNQPPTNAYVYSTSNSGPYLGAHGYYPIYGYPHYYWRPAPGSTVQLVTGGYGASSYRASSPAEANESVARGGFGRTGSSGGSGS